MLNSVHLLELVRNLQKRHLDGSIDQFRGVVYRYIWHFWSNEVVILIFSLKIRNGINNTANNAKDISHRREEHCLTNVENMLFLNNELAASTKDYV